MSWIESIDQQIQEKHLLRHPFYQAWSWGLLSKECLADYASQYYHHVKAFPTYLSALHSHTEDVNARKALLENLVEEEGGNPNHPEMWLDFASRFCSSKEEVEEQMPIVEIQRLIESFRQICLHEDPVSGIAALYAYESQVPEISESKIQGLRSFYGMKHPDDWKYFSVHIHADREHSNVEKELLNRSLNAGNIDRVKKNVQKVLDALWGFLTTMCLRHQIV